MEILIQETEDGQIAVKVGGRSSLPPHPAQVLHLIAKAAGLVAQKIDECKGDGKPKERIVRLG